MTASFSNPCYQSWIHSLSSTYFQNHRLRKSTEDLEASPDLIYCFCQQKEYGSMIQCDGPSFRYDWFHFDCVGLSQAPEGLWYCQDCISNK